MPGNINFSKFWAFVGRLVPPLPEGARPRRFARVTLKARLEQGWKLSGSTIFSHTQSVA